MGAKKIAIKFKLNSQSAKRDQHNLVDVFDVVAKMTGILVKEALEGRMSNAAAMGMIGDALADRHLVPVISTQRAMTGDAMDISVDLIETAALVRH